MRFFRWHIVLFVFTFFCWFLLKAASGFLLLYYSFGLRLLDDFLFSWLDILLLFTLLPRPVPPLRGLALHFMVRLLLLLGLSSGFSRRLLLLCRFTSFRFFTLYSPFLLSSPGGPVLFDLLFTLGTLHALVPIWFGSESSV